MNKVELEIINITQGFTQHHSYAVVLGEVKGKRRLPIVIGAAEAQAIAVAIENMPPTRPLTHDLFKTVIVERNAEGPAHIDGEPIVLGTSIVVQCVPQSLHVLVPKS